MTGYDGDIDVVKQRLKAVSSLPENQLCCDCGDKRPTWASLIVPPDGYAPDDPISKLIIGGFCCFQCSGIHRSLGTHICFVRSLTLDEWKEKEVRALEIGGNTKVNSVFEAKDMSRGRLNHDGETVPIKPNSHSNMTDRKRFIKEKYVEKKYFNAFYYDQIIKSAVDNDMHHQHRMPTSTSSRNQPGQQKKLVEDFDHSFDADWGDAFNSHNDEKEGEDFYDEFGGDGLEEEEPTTSTTTEENEHNPSDMVGAETPLEVREGYDERSGRSRSSGGGSHRSRSNSRSRSKSRSRQPRGGKKRRPGRNGVDPDQDVDSINTSNHSLSNLSLAQGGASNSSSSYNNMRPSRCKSDPLSSSEHGKSRLSARRKADPLSASEHGEGRPPTRGSNDPLGSSGHGSLPSRTRINKDPLAVSERGRPRGGGRAAMLRQRSEVIRGGGMIQLGGDLNDGSDRPPRCNSSGSSSNDLLSLSSHGGGGRGPSQRRSNTSLDSLARSEHSGTSGSVRTAPGPGGRMQMMRRQPSRTSLSNTKWSVPNDDKEEEMVHVVQNPMSITSEPIPSAAPKKLHGGGASLFGTKTNNRRSQMHRQGSERIRSKNLVVEEEVDLPIKTRRGPPARSKSDCRRSMMQRAGSTRMRSNVQKRQAVDTKALFLERQARKNALKKTAGTDTNNEEEENDDMDQSEFGGQHHENDYDELVHEVVASDEVDINSDEDSDIDDDDDDYGDDDEKAVKGRRASRSRGGGGGGGCGGGISSDRRARSMERARGRQQKKVATEPDEADEQDESDQAEEEEEKKPKGTFEFGTRRKTKPIRHDSSSSAISEALRTSTHSTNRRRRPPQSSSAGSNSHRPTRHNSKTSTSSSRDSEDSQSGRPSRHNSKTSTTSSRHSEDSHSGRPSRHNSKTSTTSSRDGEDSHSGRRRGGSHSGRKRSSAPSSSGEGRLPDNVTDVVKAPLGQSMHSQNNSSVSDDESFVEFSDEGELFDEERKAPPISQRAATGFHSSTQSMDSSFGASFASFGEEEDEYDHQQVLVEVPEL